MCQRLNLYLFAFFATGCTSTVLQHPIAFEISPDREQAKPLWEKTMPGRVSDLSVAQTGGKSIITLVPDSEYGTGLRKPILIMMDARGNTNWRYPLKSRVRSQSIAKDGSLVAVNTYDSKLTAISPKGKTVWVREKFCDPRILSSVQKILCIYSDDNRPDLAFDVLNWKGETETQYKVESEVLAVETADDEKHHVVAEVRGQLTLVGEDFKPVWKKRVSGEIADVAVSSHEVERESIVAVLFIKRINANDAGQKLAVFGPKGDLISEISIINHVDQVLVSADGSSVYLYGNSPTGQYLARFSIQFEKDGQPQLREVWQYVEKHYADFSSRLGVYRNSAIVGFENIASEKPKDPKHSFSHIFFFNTAGKVTSDLPVLSHEGAYLYGVGKEKNDSSETVIFLATDNAKYRAFQVKTGPL